MKTEEDFKAAEKRWAAQLTGRSLVIEANADPEQAAQALAILGFNYRRSEGRERKQRLLRNYRASFLVGVCTAAFKYDLGGMWPYLEQGFGTLVQGDQALLSEAFRRGLDDFGLSRFTFPRRNVDEILMHAGIPGQRMDEFIELLVRRDSLVNGLDGRQFCQWIASLNRQTAFAVHHLDAPTYRFLSQGREIAEDLVDRCLLLIDGLGGGAISAEDVANFPDIMHADLVRAFRELEEKRVTRGSRPRARRLDLAPRLTFDPRRGVAVRLPPLEVVTDTRVDWVISAEGTTSQRTVEPPWPGDPVAVVHIGIKRPAKQVTLSMNLGDQSWSLGLVDPDDPMLIFDRDTGELIPPKNSLPKGEVWLAVPNDDGHLFADLIDIDGAIDNIRLLEAPLGWSGWVFAAVSMANVTKLRPVGLEHWRYVSSISRPVIDFANEVRHVRGPEGHPVCSSLPRVIVPAVVDSTGSGSTVEWEATITHIGTGAILATATTLARSAPMEVDFAWPSDAALMGTYEFSVKGPLGRGIVRRANVVSDLEITADHEFRAMAAAGDGLVPSGFWVLAAPGLMVPDRVELDSRTATTVLKVARDDESLSLSVTIPAMAVTSVVGSREATPSHSPIHVDLEELASSQLRVTFGNPHAAQLVVMKGEELLQTVTAQALGQLGIATFNLAQLVDSLSASGGASLLVGVGGARIPVARVRPRQLADGATFDDGVIVLENLSTDHPLEIALYRRYAPWLGPTVVKAGGEVTDLPESLQGEGELRVVVRVADPWVAHEWPREYPSRTLNVFDIHLGDLTDAGGGDDQGYRSWLKRTAPCPTTPAGLPLAMGLYLSRDLEKYMTTSDELRGELSAAMAVHSDLFPAAYTQIDTHKSAIDMFVGARVAVLPPGKYPHGPTLWESSPVLAVLAQQWGSDDRDSDGLMRVLGPSALSILDSGTDTHQSVGRFGPEWERIANFPPDRIDVIWRTIGAVPGRLLDLDPRTIAAKQMFDQRGRIPFNFAKAYSLLPIAQQVIGNELGVESLAPIAARHAAPGWMSLPAMTIAFSLVARAAARGFPRALELYEHSERYLKGLAQMSPKLVEQDLILSELWLTRWSAS